MSCGKHKLHVSTNWVCHRVTQCVTGHHTHWELCTTNCSTICRLACQSHSQALVTKHHTRAHDQKGRAHERTGLSQDHFGGARQIHTWPLRQKKCPNWVYKKSFFSCIELNEIDQNFTNFTKFYYCQSTGVLAS